MPKRIQLKRTKGWRKPEGAVVVARPSIWGNPFVVGAASGCDFKDGGDPTPLIEAMTLDQCIAFYEGMVSGFLSPEMHPHGHDWMDRFRKSRSIHPIEVIRSDLRGKDLACWCPLISHGAYVPCHADVLLRLANE